MQKTVTLFPGDGIGPEITQSMKDVFQALNVDIVFEEFEAGIRSYEKTGELLPERAKESFRKNKVALKAPLTTPIGKGFRSINVQLRREFDLYANIRPAKSYPQLQGKFDNVDIVVFRENTEDIYIGEEELVSPDEAFAVKRITRSASERISKLAFEYCQKQNKKRLTCVHKANILKLTDGLFLESFRDVAKEYPSVNADDVIVDAVCMQLVMFPERFDVLVMPNLYGDIVSDLCSGLIGGLGLLPSVNRNDEYAMFEAVHGSAPDIAGQDLANPSAFLLASAMMLEHLEYVEEAARIRDAIDGVLKNPELRTKDLGGEAGTKAFTKSLIAQL